VNNHPKPASLGRRASTSEEGLKWLPENTVDAIKRTVKRRFHRSAITQITDARWSRYAGENMDARRPFTWVYNELLATAVEGYTDLLTQAILSSHGRHKPIHWLEIAASAVRFVEKFADDDYVENLLGLFLEHQRQMQDPNEKPDWLSGIAVLPATADGRPGILSHWKPEAIERAKHQIQLRVLLTPQLPAGRAGSGPRVVDFESMAKIRSFRYGEAASYFECGVHTIQRWIREGKLSRAGRGRVKNDSKFLTALYEFHGIPQPNT
jgi:hypothetical protein